MYSTFARGPAAIFPSIKTGSQRSTVARWMRRNGEAVGWDPQRSRAPVNDCERCAVDTTLLVPGGTGTPWSTAPDVADSCGPVLRHATSGPPQEKHTPPRAPRKWCNLHHFHPGSRRMKRRIFVATTKSLDTTWRFRHVVICYAGRCAGFPTSDIIIAAPRGDAHAASAAAVEAHVPRLGLPAAVDEYVAGGRLAVQAHHAEPVKIARASASVSHR